MNRTRSLSALSTTPWRMFVLPAIAAALVGCGASKPEEKKPAPLPVTAVAVETKDVPDRRRFPGTTQAVQEVTVIARIEGFLEQRLFEEGSLVEAGTPLFIIEQVPYEAEVLKASGEVIEAEAALELARVDFDRNAPLAETGAVSVQELDQYAANLASARGRLETARAALIEAEIRLEYTEVRSPLAGRVGQRLVDVGNVVGGTGNPSQLATIVQVDPMRVVFEPPGSDVVAFLEAWPERQVTVQISLAGENGGKPIEGRLDLVDNVANTSTSTFLARATFPNADGRVLPGLVADLVVDLGVAKDQLVVPEAAIRSDPQTSYVWVVVDGKLARKEIETGTQWQGLRVVTGIAAGDKVVVAGNPLALRTGMPVSVTEKTARSFLAESSKGGSKGKGSSPNTHSSQSPAAKASLHDTGAAGRHSGGGGG